MSQIEESTCLPLPPPMPSTCSSSLNTKQKDHEKKKKEKKEIASHIWLSAKIQAMTPSPVIRKLQAKFSGPYTPFRLRQAYHVVYSAIVLGKLQSRKQSSKTELLRSIALECSCNNTYCHRTKSLRRQKDLMSVGEDGLGSTPVSDHVPS